MIMSLTNQISTSLEDLLYLEDVKGALLFRLDGAVISAKYNSEQHNIQTLLQALLWSKANIQQVSVHIQKSNLEKAIYELEETTILFFRVDRISILCVICEKDANISLISLEAKRYSANLKKYTR